MTVLKILYSSSKYYINFHFTRHKKTYYENYFSLFPMLVDAIQLFVAHSRFSKTLLFSKTWKIYWARSFIQDDCFRCTIHHLNYSRNRSIAYSKLIEVGYCCWTWIWNNQKISCYKQIQENDNLVLFLFLKRFIVPSSMYI